MNAYWKETGRGHRFVYEGDNAVAIFIDGEGMVTHVDVSCNKTTYVFDIGDGFVYRTTDSFDEHIYGDGIVYAGVFNESDKDWLIVRALECCVSGSDFNVSVLLSKNISLIAKPTKKGGLE